MDKEKRKEYNRNYYQNHKEQWRKDNKKWKAKNPKLVREQQKRYRARHKEERKIYLEENKERIKEDYLKNKELILERAKEYYQENKEKCKENCRKWDTEHKEERKIIRHRRRCKKRKLVEDFTPEQLKELRQSYNGICPGHNKPSHYVGSNNLSIDHSPAISVAPEGFVYTIDDIQFLCRSCNSSKKDKLN